MKKLLTILTLLIPFACYSQTLPTKKEQYEFLKWYVKYKKLENVALSDTTSLLAYNEAGAKEFVNVLRAPKILSKANIDHLKKQLTNKVARLDKNEIQDVRWRVNYHSDSLSTHISLPALSIDKRLAFIQYGYHCGGTCGMDGIEVYQRSPKVGWFPSKLPFYFTLLKY